MVESGELHAKSHRGIDAQLRKLKRNFVRALLFTALVDWVMRTATVIVLIRHFVPRAP